MTPPGESASRFAVHDPLGTFCEVCGRDQEPGEHDWLIGADGEDVCPLCAESLRAMERAAIERLPKRIGLR